MTHWFFFSRVIELKTWDIIQVLLHLKTPLIWLCYTLIPCWFLSQSFNSNYKVLRKYQGKDHLSLLNFYCNKQEIWFYLNWRRMSHCQVERLRHVEDRETDTLPMSWIYCHYRGSRHTPVQDTATCCDRNNICGKIHGKDLGQVEVGKHLTIFRYLT